MRAITALVVVAALAAGCAGPAATATGSAAPPSVVAGTPSPAVPSVAPSVAPSAAPSQDPAASPAGVLPVPDGPLAPGSYRSTALGPTISFRVDGADWVGFADIPDVGFAVSTTAIPGGMSVTTFHGEVFAQPCSPDETATIEPTADAFLAWLEDHPELQAGERTEVMLGGHPAIQLDLTSDVPPECPERPRIWLWVLPTVGDFHLDENEAARFIVADVGDRPIVVVIESFEASRQPDLLDAVQPILDSMTIEP